MRTLRPAVTVAVASAWFAVGAAGSASSRREKALPPPPAAAQSAASAPAGTAAVERIPPAAAAGLGERLFDGAAPLAARIVGQDFMLPAQAGRCANCHLREERREATGAESVLSRRYGPVLNASALALPAARRGGPASRFDAASFCRLLRDGIDPAFVMLSRSMPRYEIALSECEALWSYLNAHP